jgi:hypothetical protein
VGAPKVRSFALSIDSQEIRIAFSLSTWGDGLFLEKHSRFLRLYDLRFSPRHKGAAFLPLTGGSKNFSVLDALQKHIDSEKALVVQQNGDVIELMSVQDMNQCLVLLFHRASPNAADPSYRKKARAAAGKKVTLRQSTKAPDEEQSVSALLVVRHAAHGPGIYRSALEEIPGIAMGSVRHIIGAALKDYSYDFLRGKQKVDTYSVFRPEGLKSETLTNALKKGRLGFVTLSRPAKAPFVDSDGLFKPVRETMKLQVVGEVTSGGWKTQVGKLLRAAKLAGWEDFSVDIGLENDRQRTVQLDREDEAKEVLFVKSELISLAKPLATCSLAPSPEVVQKLKGAVEASFKKG